MGSRSDSKGRGKQMKRGGETSDKREGRKLCGGSVVEVKIKQKEKEVPEVVVFIPHPPDDKSLNICH